MDIRELYQEVILDHSRRPRNHGECPGATGHASAENPSCGDEVAVHVRIGADLKVEAVTFTGQGCALSQASASLMTLKVRGLPVGEAAEAIHRVHRLMTGGKLEAAEREMLGDIEILEGAAQYPQRVKCVTLAWHALDQILKGNSNSHVVEE